MSDQVCCPHCHKELSTTGRFCMFCGQELFHFCPGCGLAVPVEGKFCPECGTALAKQEKKEKKPAGKVVPKESILGSGEYRFATVIFADISGFTTLSEDLDPEEVTDIMNGCFDRFVAVINHYGGAVDKFIGDCVMCLFGAPKAHEDDPERAIHCASEMLTELAAYNDEIGYQLGVSIGINCGKVYAGLVGGRDQHDFTVMGDTVNTAQRLEAAAGRNQIYVSERFYRLTGYMCQYDSLPPLSLKGKKEPQQVHRFRKLLKEPGSRRDTLVGHDLPLQGREKELAVISGCLEHLNSGLGGILSICGESGMGKTRLGREICRRGRELDFHVLQCQAESYGRGWLLSLLRGVFQSELFQQFWELQPFDAVESRLVDIIQGRHVSEEVIDPQNCQETKFRITGLLLRFLRQVSSEKPLLFLLDDLQFTDVSSLEMLIEITEACIGDTSILFCLLFRPDIDPSWVVTPLTIQLTLDPLDPRSLKRMVRDFYEVEISAKLQHYLLKRCEGNPLYLLEYLNLFQDTELIQIENNCLTLSSAFDESFVPDTLNGLISASLDRLQKNSRQILQTAAVIGRKFSYRLLKETLPEKDTLHQNLAEILKKKLLEELNRFPELEYIFRTALTWEVAYRIFSRKQLRTSHQVIAQAVEKVYENQLPLYYETLADHYKQAHNKKKASYFAHKAYERNKALGDLGAAISYLQDLIVQADDELEIVHFKLELLELYVLIGSFDQAEQLISEIKTQASQNMFSQLDQARFFLARGTVASHQGQLDQGQNYLTCALNGAQSIANEKLAAWILLRMAFLAFRRGQYDQAREQLEDILKQSHAIADQRLGARCLEGLANLAAEQGLYDQAEEKYSQAFINAQASNEKILACNIQFNIAALYHDLEKFEQAEAEYRRALELAHNLGNIRVFPYLEYNLGEIKFRQDNLTDALPHFEKAYQWAQKQGEKSILVISQLFLTYCSQDQNRTEKLVELVAQIQGSPDHKALGHFLLVKAFLESTQVELAREQLELAQQIVDQGSATWLQPKIETIKNHLKSDQL
ncbi:adenylate/guanylate cyclase domain-containing protein [candidate division CSSED10-310 bacterium]|uniref:Adenylate/guanylate cyclase domain-containing protein n=1 Tax=candidate division CSSED10-310 bacterium TaxID=2855610 RepID=A0ABV6Z142_UNCC1